MSLYINICNIKEYKLIYKSIFSFHFRNKRKVQNLLPCKTPTRGPHISGALSALASGHAVTYEDPDAHLGHHRPLVMRHHHNVEVSLLFIILRHLNAKINVKFIRFSFVYVNAFIFI